MEDGVVLRLILLSYFALYILIRAYYRTKTGTLNEKPSQLEGILPAFRAIMRLPYALIFATWFAMPGLVRWFSIGAPAWFQWSGSLILAASLLMLAWVHKTLGLNFSSTLRVTEYQTLVTCGPYRRIRHPMYTAVFLSVIGLCMITSNWLTLIFSLPMMAPAIANRMALEERMLIEKFGDEYRRYMGQTGRLLPKII